MISKALIIALDGHDEQLFKHGLATQLGPWKASYDIVSLDEPDALSRFAQKNYSLVVLSYQNDIGLAELGKQARGLRKAHGAARIVVRGNRVFCFSDMGMDAAVATGNQEALFSMVNLFAAA